MVIRPEKKFRLLQDFNPLPPRYQYSTPPSSFCCHYDCVILSGHCGVTRVTIVMWSASHTNCRASWHPSRPKRKPELDIKNVCCSLKKKNNNVQFRFVFVMTRVPRVSTVRETCWSHDSSHACHATVLFISWCDPNDGNPLNYRQHVSF